MKFDKKKYVVSFMPVAHLTANTVQPEGRTSDGAVASLAKTIEASGYIHPLLVTPGGTVIDGHRRARCAELLGYEEVPVIVLRADAEEAFGRANKDQKPIGGSGWFQGWARHGDPYLSVMPKGQAAHIREMVRIFGRGASMGYAEAGLTPSYATRIVTIAAILAKVFPDAAPDVRKVGRWMLAKNGRPNLAYVASRVKQRGPLRKLLNAINQDKDLSL